MKRQKACDAVEISYYGRTVIDARKLLNDPRVQEIVRQVGSVSKKQPKVTAAPTP